VLLERDREVELLAGLLAGVGSSGGKVVLVRGEVGVGKTSLVKEFVGRHCDEAHVLSGFCDDLTTPRPLGPFYDIARTEPSIHQALSDGDRSALFEALLDLLSRSLRSTVLVVEDTQWADEATLDAIRYLGRRISSTNGMLVLTYRDEEVDYDHPLRTVIGSLAPQDLTRIGLDCLSSDAVEEMLVGTPTELGLIMRLTDGNPLFVTELLASGEDQVPASVRDSVMARAAKLSQGAREVLDLVSVIPGESSRQLIDSVIGASEEDLSQCVRGGLLDATDGPVTFRHEFSRRVVESSLSAGRRRGLNARVLTELAAAADLVAPARLSHHAAEADDTDAIIEFAPQAARAAMEVGSHREAATHFRALEPHLERIPAEDRAGIVDDWAHNEFHLDEEAAHEILMKAVGLYRTLGDDLALARALTFAVRLNEKIGRHDEADACSTEAIDILQALPAGSDLALALAQRAWLFLMFNNDQQALDFADQAIDLAEQTNDEQTIIYALNTKGCATFRHGDPNGLEMLREAEARANAIGDHFEDARAFHNMGSVSARLRKLDQAEHFYQRALGLQIRYEMPVAELADRIDLAELWLRQGKSDAAEDTLTEILATNPHLPPFVSGQAWSTRARFEARRGRPTAPETLNTAWSESDASARWEGLWIPPALAECMWLTGDRESDRLTRLRETLARGIRIQLDWDSGELALWLWKMGELDEAPEGIAAPYRLIIDGHPLKAAELWAEIGAPYEEAIALSHGPADAQLQALEKLDTLGATAVAAKLRQQLRDQGVKVPRGKAQTTKQHGAGLTARQAEVLTLLSEGLTNPEIADRLFVSPRTVEHHVSAVLSKLDATTRQDAVSQAHQQGLLTAK
jgi:DNA-binding CsgD family transcriptional regulator/tetratricopeptide (TPR) repeat protein